MSNIESTTLFQAFEFVFGHDTDVPEAEVTVTLQREELGIEKIVNFKHSKKSLNNNIEETYGIKMIKHGTNYRVRQLYNILKLS